MSVVEQLGVADMERGLAEARELCAGLGSHKIGVWRWRRRWMDSLTGCYR